MPSLVYMTTQSDLYPGSSKLYNGSEWYFIYLFHMDIAITLDEPDALFKV